MLIVGFWLSIESFSGLVKPRAEAAELAAGKGRWQQIWAANRKKYKGMKSETQHLCIGKAAGAEKKL